MYKLDRYFRQTYDAEVISEHNFDVLIVKIYATTV